MSNHTSVNQNHSNQTIGLDLIDQKELSNIIINSLPGVFYLFDENGKFLQWNKNFETVTGYSEEEVSNMTPLDFFVGSDKELVFERISKVFTEGKAEAIADFCTKNNEKVPYHFNGRLIDHEGKRCLIGMGVDITRLKEIEKERIRQQNFLKAINEIQSQFILEKDGPRFFDFTLTKILELTKSEYGFIGEVLSDKNGEYVKTLAITNIAWDETTRNHYAKNSPTGLEFRNPKTLFGEIIASKNHIISNSPYQDSRRGGQPTGHPPMNTFMGVPLMLGDRIIGMFGVANCLDGYHEATVDFLKPLTTVITNILEVVRSDRDRKQAEARLERTAKRLELATKSSGLGIWQIDFVNNAWEPDERLREILGIRETTLTHETFLTILHPDDRERKRVRDKEKMEQKGTQYYDEYKIIRPVDGEIRYLKSRGVFFRDENGKPTGGISVVYDQTREKQDTLSLQEAKERLERVITSIREGIWEQDLETNTFHFSPGWKEMYGYVDEDIINFEINWAAFVHPDDIQLVGEMFDKALNGAHKTFDVEFRSKHKDGHFQWSRLRCLVTFNASGKPIKLTGSNEDITERKRMEQSLAKGESHLRTILAAEPECVKLLDRNCNLLDMNPAGLAMIEADSLDKVRGACVIDLIKPEYRAAFVELNKEAFKGKSGNLTFEVVGLKGTSRWLESNVVPLIDGTGNIMAALGVTKDVTEHKLYEAELIANNKEKDFLIL